MTSSVDDDDVDLGDHAPPARQGRRRSYAGTTNIISEADKDEAEALARKGAAQWRQRLRAVFIFGLLLIGFICLLTYITAKTLLAPEPDAPFTKAAPKPVATSPELSTFSSVSIVNGSVAELDAVEYTIHTADPDVQSGPLLDVTDEPTFCGTTHCRNLASFLNNLLGPRRETCGSLYDQVCSRWARSHRRIAESRSRYSVDEAVLDVYLQQVNRLLLDPSVPLNEQRSFYADCVNGRLLTEQDLQDITNDITLPDEGWTPETFANAVARMSRIGVSPFFDVSVQASNDSFLVKIHLLDSSRARRSNDNDIEGNGSNYEKRNISSDNIENVRRNKLAFFSALERLVCQDVTEMSALNVSCVVTSELPSQTSWGSEWYTSTGPTLLAGSVAFMLEDLSLYSKAVEEKIDLRTSFRVVPLSEEERSTRCLRFIDQHDPTLMPHLITTYIAPRIEYDAQKTFARLKATLDRYMPNAAAVGIDFLATRVPNDSSLLYEHWSDLYGSHTATNVSRLRKFLVSSTWKRWTGAFIPDASSLSSTPTLSRDGSTVHVPAGVFNLTTNSDKWLQVLSLARAGPLLFRALFSLRHLPNELNKTRFFQCVSELAKLLHGFRESPVSGQERAPQWLDGLQIASRDISLRLDLKEMASFYLSLQAYRALVGEGVAVPGTALNSDSLFLLYYAFNKCQVEVRSKEPNTGVKKRWRYARVLRYRGMPEDGADARRQVDSVAAMFGGLLFKECQRITDLSTCRMGSEEEF